MNEHIDIKEYKKSYYELERIKQTILECVAIKENILAMLDFARTLNKNIFNRPDDIAKNCLKAKNLKKELGFVKHVLFN